jgi:hypothetical protein
MRNRAILFAVVFFACASFASALDPDELNKITFKNTTGADIQMIFLSPSDSDDWGPDIMGADWVLGNGKSIGFYIHYPDSSFNFDIMAMDKAGNTFELYEYTMKDGKEAMITLGKKDLKKSPPKLDFVTLTIENKTGKEIDYLFVSPVDSDAYGVDLLDEESVLAAGDSIDILVPVGDKTSSYDILAVDDGLSDYTFTLDLDPATGEEQVVAVDASDLDTGD